MKIKDPLVIAPAAALAACALLYVVDPATGVYPPCPSQLLFGIDCPACGGLRATSALLHGDISSFLDHNLLLAIVFPTLAIAWIFAVWQKRYPQMKFTRLKILITQTNRRGLWVGGALVLVAYTLARNVFPYLGSGIG